MSTLIYFFNQRRVDGDRYMTNLLGNKGANLAEMSRLGLPIPPGFTITTEVSDYYLRYQSFPSDFLTQLEDAVKYLEQITYKTLGHTLTPLLLSVRSGGEISMPGIMDTILNVGCNDQVAGTLNTTSLNSTFGFDVYRRLIQSYSEVVYAIPPRYFEDILNEYMQKFDIYNVCELPAKCLIEIINKFHLIFKEHTKEDFPKNPRVQLLNSIKGVINSVNNNRAKEFARHNNVVLKTAINVQMMVFGNKNFDSATGVLFTRNPVNGRNEIYGEFLVRAQGKEVVDGTLSPLPLLPIDEKPRMSLSEFMPEIFDKLRRSSITLEQHYKAPQDIEFTIESRELYILQTRTAKLSPEATIKIAVDMVEAGIITQQEALLRVDAQSLTTLLHKKVLYTYKTKIIARGIPVSAGAVTGVAVFCPNMAIELSKIKNVILFRSTTTTDDIKGIYAANALVMTNGGTTAHAAVIVRNLGKPCVNGIIDMQIIEEQRLCYIGKLVIKEGDVVTIDGTEGNLIMGEENLIEAGISSEISTLMLWAKMHSQIKVRANVETVRDFEAASKFHIDGIGLCRTEHMFFDDENKLNLMRLLILSDNVERQEIIKELLPLHTQDFLELFTAVDGRPINVRLLDPPLHEFLPKSNNMLALHAISDAFGINIDSLIAKCRNLEETNPMLGLRGVRLGVVYPEIYRMQLQAILMATYEMRQYSKIVQLEIMLPFVSIYEELERLSQMVHEVKDEIYGNEYFYYKIGTMIELPRAALISGKLAKIADYFSFGTNDMTQTVYGMSRDDSFYLDKYLNQNILLFNPFVTLDQDGVGALIELALKQGRDIKPHLTSSVCGEHLANLETMLFYQKQGINYVSCSPYYIPTARLAAAQAHITTNT